MGLKEKIKSKKAMIGVIGLGYVGLPLIKDFIEVGFKTIGFDTDISKVRTLMNGRSYIKSLSPALMKKWLSTKKFHATTDMSELSKVDVAIICVPTPLNDYRGPDLSMVLGATKNIAKVLKKEQLVILESTTYPGTTDEDMKQILEGTGMKVGRDFCLGFSPEREDPSVRTMSKKAVPKIVSGSTKKCLALVKALYDTIYDRTVPVSSTRVAESAKLLENIYRTVNIALMNELKILFKRMNIDIWEVIEAAKTKPYGFQAFYPGPGLGGHCIPIDPFYLTWKAHQFDFSTDFIELAGEINTDMPYYIVERICEVMNGIKKTVNGSKVLVLGVAYKKDIDDPRESPAFPIIKVLLEKGAEVVYNDPYIPLCRGHGRYKDIWLHSQELTSKLVSSSDLVLLITDHSNYDYKFIAKHAKCVIDTRNAFEKHGVKSEKIHKA